MKIPADKKQHIIASLCEVLIVGSFLGMVAGVVISLIVGALKEVVWDWMMKRGTPDWMDFAADVVGAILGALALCVICYIFKGSL